MAEKTVDQKLKECKTLIIQNVEKGVQNAMIFRYLKDEKIENDLESHRHNAKDGYITLKFYDHEKARQYYDKANFRDKILIRPFNIYFNVQLNENEMKKYYFEGANEENIRKMFDMARKIGVLKVYTSYTSPLAAGKLKSTGLLSFIRKDPITEQELNSFKEELSTIGVKIYNYTPDKGMKCALSLTDFYKGDLDESIEVLEKNAKDQATAILKGAMKDFSGVTNITPIVKRREIPNPDSKQGSKTVTKVKAMVQLGEYDTALKIFEQIRTAFVKQEAKAYLNFYNAETNSYISLFTSGLHKNPEAKTDKLNDKEFEDVLVNIFRKVNPNIVQVNVFPSGNTYVARVYLKNEDEGRKFIVDYSNYRNILVEHYKSKQNIRFNINVDDKTMKKIKQFEKKVGQIQANIKNEADRQKQIPPKHPHHIPIGPQGNFPMMPPMPHSIMNQGPKVPIIGSHPPMPNQQGYPIPFNSQMGPQMGGMGPQIGMPPSNMGFGMTNPTMVQKPPVMEIRTKIDKMYEKKAHFVETCKNDREHEETTKKQSYPSVKFVLQNDMKIPSIQANLLASKILQNNDIGSIIDFLKKPREFFDKLSRS